MSSCVCEDMHLVFVHTCYVNKWPVCVAYQYTGTRNKEELIPLYLKQLSSLASSKASVPWP